MKASTPWSICATTLFVAVIAGLVPAIHSEGVWRPTDRVDRQDKPGGDDLGEDWLKVTPAA